MRNVKKFYKQKAQKYSNKKGETQMKKHKINKAKLAINILKAECMFLLALVYDVMFIAYLIK